MAEFFQNQRQALARIGKSGVHRLQKQLVKLDKNASGRTSKSIHFIQTFTLKKATLEIRAAKAIININDGRGAGKKQPPPDVILDWIKERNLKGTFEDGKPMPDKVLAFLIGRSISINGIKPTNLISTVFEKKSFTELVRRRVEAAGKEDIKVRTSTLAKQV